MPTPNPSTSEQAPPPDERYRLPRTAEPHRYRLTLSPDLDGATFEGRVEIDLTLHEPTTSLVCNAAELTIHESSVEDEEGRTIPAGATVDPDEERVVFAVEEELAPGPAVLRCRFSGILNDKLHGFYRSTFRDDAGTEHVVATTQMEATDARRAFPCWDEPDRKAVFEVTLEVADGLAAFSNSPVVAEAPLAGGRRAVRFAPTIKMSTYLVAFIVGPLEATEPRNVDGVAVRVVHVPGRGHLTEHALDVAAHALRFFSKYFDLPYPGDKLDLVAIPDFAFGAMENLGCVTFRETALLVDTGQAARVELERIADVVSHEIAHMWFGDLVTMRWWNGIWLNEAFATFMEILCVDAYRPTWQRWTSFGLERESALAVDGLHSTRPVEYPVGRPEEAEGMFDVLTYQKGGAVLRMLEQYITPEVFRDGVRAYLRRHAHANTDTGDLWDALETVSGEPVREVMDTWIFQGGFPLVRAGAELSQAPFAYRPSSPGDDSAIHGPWKVPVIVRSLDGASAPERLLLSEEPATVAQTTTSAVVNAGGWGFYRVSYPSEHLEALGHRLGDLDPLERFNLLTDTWALTLSGSTQLSDFLALSSGLGDDDEPATWQVVAGALGLIDRVASDGDREVLAGATRDLLGHRAEALGWERAEGEGERIAGLRALLLRTLGTIGRAGDVRQEALARFDATLQGGSPLDPDLESAVLEVVAAQLRPGDFDLMLERYRKPATPQEEMRYLYSLSAFPDVALAQRAFALALEEVRTQNAPFLIHSLLANRVAGPTVWQRVTENWDAILGRFPTNTLSRMVDGVRTLCADPELASSVARFLRDHPLPSGERSVAQTLERLEVNVSFGRHEGPRLGSVLAGTSRRS